MDRKLFGEKLKKLRIERGLSLSKLAKELKVCATMLSKYERGIVAPNLKFLHKVVIYFGVSCDYLLGLPDL